MLPMNEQQSGVTTEPVESMSLQEALAVMSCSQIRGHRRYGDLKRAAQKVIDEHAQETVDKWPDQM